MKPIQQSLPLGCFNTQPPEGGWLATVIVAVFNSRFNTQPPEGGWYRQHKNQLPMIRVSTHSRPKAAGTSPIPSAIVKAVSTHSRPKAAGGPFMYIR